VRWHVSDALMAGRTVRIKGRTPLWADDAGWHLGETRLLDIEEKTLDPRRQPSLAQPQAGIVLSRPPDIIAAERSLPGRGAAGGSPQ
jgi:hypothetical protein